MSGAPGYERDPRVDAYLDALPAWQRQLCQELRDLIHGVDPEMTETIKRTVRPDFVLHGNVAALLAAKDTSTCSSTTARSSPTRKASSPAA